MNFIFSNVPVDIIVYLGKFLDYDSIINLNRTMQPCDRLVHRRFTNTELLLHEIQAIAQGKKYVLSNFNNIYHPDLKRRTQKRCKKLLELLRGFRKNKRAFLIVKRNAGLRSVILAKCQDILDAAEDRNIFGGNFTNYYRIKLTREAIALMEEVHEVALLNIDELSKSIVIYRY